MKFLLQSRRDLATTHAISHATTDRSFQNRSEGTTGALNFNHSIQLMLNFAAISSSMFISPGDNWSILFDSSKRKHGSL